MAMISHNKRASSDDGDLSSSSNSTKRLRTTVPYDDHDVNPNPWSPTEFAGSNQTAQNPESQAFLPWLGSQNDFLTQNPPQPPPPDYPYYETTLSYDDFNLLYPWLIRYLPRVGRPMSEMEAPSTPVRYLLKGSAGFPVVECPLNFTSLPAFYASLSAVQNTFVQGNSVVFEPLDISWGIRGVRVLEWGDDLEFETIKKFIAEMIQVEAYLGQKLASFRVCVLSRIPTRDSRYSRHMLSQISGPTSAAPDSPSGYNDGSVSNDSLENEISSDQETDTPRIDLYTSRDTSTSESDGEYSTSPQEDRRLPSVSSGKLATMVADSSEIATHGNEAQIIIRLQKDTTGKFSAPYDKSVLHPKFSTSTFFQWLSRETDQPLQNTLRFILKDAMPIPITIEISRGQEYLFRQMRKDIKIQLKKATSWLPGLKEFAVLVTLPDVSDMGVLEEEW